MSMSYIEVAWGLSRVSRRSFVPRKDPLWMRSSEDAVCGSVCTKVDPFSANSRSHETLPPVCADSANLPGRVFCAV